MRENSFFFREVFLSAVSFLQRKITCLAHRLAYCFLLGYWDWGIAAKKLPSSESPETFHNNKMVFSSMKKHLSSALGYNIRFLPLTVPNLLLCNISPIWRCIAFCPGGLAFCCFIWNFAVIAVENAFFYIKNGTFLFACWVKQKGSLVFSCILRRCWNLSPKNNVIEGEKRALRPVLSGFSRF